MGLLWILYIDYIVYRSKSHVKKVSYPLVFLFLLNAAISIMSIRTGWYFSITSDNFYSRGDFYFLHMLICYIYLIYTIIFIIFHRNKVGKRFYLYVILFAVPPMVGGIIQALFYGISIGWSATCLSVLIFYFSLQNKEVNTDYLTGVHNRRYLDYFIGQKLINCKNKRYAVILIDINNFKIINDLYGHDIGDDALKAASSILRKSTKGSDFIARYGGDEFYVVMEINNPNDLQRTVEKIRKNLADFNSSGRKKYKLGFSMGYDIFDEARDETPQEFLKRIDLMMYEYKNKR